MTVLTRKFSEFVQAEVEEVVGLSAGANTIGSGGGGGGALTEIVDQDMHGFVPGNWVYVSNDVMAPYKKAIATSITTSNVAGLVTSTPTENQFVIQFVGHLEPVNPLTFLGAPFELGGSYFLSATNAGEMTLTEPTGAGEYSMPVFYAESTLTGLIHQSRQLTGNSFAPSNDRFIVQEADPVNLPNAQSLGALNSGIVYNNKVGDVGTLSTLPVVPLELGGTNTVLTDPGMPALFGWKTGPNEAIFYGIGTGLAIIGDQLVNTSPGDTNTIRLIDQPGHGFMSPTDLGKAVRTDSTSTTANPVYVFALANNAQNAEAVGLIVGIPNVNQFYLQQVGYNNIFTGLDVNSVYFLSDTDLGVLTTDIPVITGHVSKPMLLPEGPTSGWVVPMRGVVVGESSTPPTPGDNDLLQQIVTQDPNDFALGTIVRLEQLTPTTSHYVRADPKIKDGVQAIGMIVETPNPGVTFVVQQSGYVGSGTGAVTGLQAGKAYYLDPTVGNEGMLTITEPTTPGIYSKLAFITNTDESGWLCEQREQLITAPPGTDTPVTITAANSFVLGDIVQPQVASPFYKLAQANNEDNANSVGMIVYATGTQFTVQQNGFTNVLGGLMPALTASTPYWLSPIMAGKITATKPTTVGQVVKPVFYSTDTSSGWIQEQVGILIEATPVPGSGAIVQVINSSNNTTQSFFTGAGTWVTLPGYSNTITPSSVASKVRITLQLSIYCNNNIYFRIQRNGNTILSSLCNTAFNAPTDPSSSGQRGVSMGTVAGQPDLLYYSFIDSPATTSPVAYTFIYSTPSSSTVYLNVGFTYGNANGLGGLSFITLEEIA